MLCFHETEGTSPGKPLPGLSMESISKCEVPHMYGAAVTDSTGFFTTAKPADGGCHLNNRLFAIEVEGSLRKFKLKY